MHYRTSQQYPTEPNVDAQISGRSVQRYRRDLNMDEPFYEDVTDQLPMTHVGERTDDGYMEPIAQVPIQQQPLTHVAVEEPGYK